MDQLIGQTIADKYTVEYQLGAGGTGIVYQAHDSVLDRDVALKLIRGQVQDVSQFIHEARLIARLEHPHILPVYDFGTHVSDEQNYPYVCVATCG